MVSNWKTSSTGKQTSQPTKKPYLGIQFWSCSTLFSKGPCTHLDFGVGSGFYTRSRTRQQIHVAHRNVRASSFLQHQWSCKAAEAAQPGNLPSVGPAEPMDGLTMRKDNARSCMLFYVNLLLILVSFSGWGKVLVLETSAMFAWWVMGNTQLDLALHSWLHYLGRTTTPQCFLQC